MILIDKLKILLNTVIFSKLCNKNCNQGRNCSCNSISFAQAIIDVHTIASKVEYTDISMELRQLADRLAQLGNQYHDRVNPSIGAQEKNLED
jgi:hypothetical protein